MIAMLMQAAQAVAGTDTPGWGQRILDFVDTPAPYSPFSEYLLVLFVLWLIARRAEAKTENFDEQAQDVLDEKFAKGELSRQAYEKYRQEMALRVKR
jgi:hypothetical protein